MSNVDAIRYEIRISGQHYIGAVGQWTSDRIIGVASHDHMMSQSGSFEILQISRKMPWELIIITDDTISTHRHYSTHYHNLYF